MKCGGAFNSKGEWQAANGKKRLKESGDAPEKKKRDASPVPPRTKLIRIGGPFGRIGARRFADCPFLLATRFDCEWHSRVPESIRGLRGCLATIRTWTEISLLGKAWK